VGTEPSEEVYRRLLHVFHILRNDPVPGILDIIPAYNSLTLVYDPLKLQIPEHNSAYFFLQEKLSVLLETGTGIIPDTQTPVRIPVCYNTSLAPDLEMLAEMHSLTVEEVIQIHTGCVYRVYMLGFLPGFAYMGTVDPRIQTPRKASPRTIVPAGSVGIAGIQTGIYPLASPGGWQLIGRTPLQVFQPDAPNPCLLQPGEQVEFYPISLEAFEAWPH
jgi:inhibitor of KinA